jgi:hypothetical protein
VHVACQWLSAGTNPLPRSDLLQFDFRSVFAFCGKHLKNIIVAPVAQENMKPQGWDELF